jgi:phenylalanyl-tRNA synthetase beta chain
MRMHMLPGLLDALAINTARHNRPVRMFEVGRIYRWSEEEAQDIGPAGPTAAIDRRLPQEISRAGVLLYAGRSDRSEADASAGTAREVAGILLEVLHRLGLEAEILPRDAGSSAPYLHPGVQARIMVLDNDGVREVGLVGELHPDLVAKWDLPSGARAHYGEIHIDLLPPPRVAKLSPLPRFPATSRDVSLEVPRSLPSSVVIDALREAAAAIDQSAPPGSDDPPRLTRGDEGDAAVEVVEDYRGEGISTEHKALLVRLHYRAGKRSITDAEVQLMHDAIVSRACEALAAAAPGIRRR